MRIEGLTKRFIERSRRPSVDGLSLIESGEFVVLLGHSGCRKILTLRSWPVSGNAPATGGHPRAGGQTVLDVRRRSTGANKAADRG